MGSSEKSGFCRFDSITAYDFAHFTPKSGQLMAPQSRNLTQEIYGEGETVFAAMFTNRSPIQKGIKSGIQGG
jgi:hypothetical protein